MNNDNRDQLIIKFDYINHAVFKEFKWPKDLKRFLRYNLIYAPNGSGKTTIACILRLIECYQRDLPIDDYRTGDFTISYGGKTIRKQDLANQAKTLPPIRVFTKEFVKRNVECDTVNGIVRTGEGNIEAKKNLEEKKSELTALEGVLKEREPVRKSKKDALESILISGARRVRDLLKMNTQQFDKGHLKQLCDQRLTLGANDLINEEKLAEWAGLYNSEIKLDITETQLPLQEIIDLGKQVNEILETTVVSQEIPELKDKPWTQWVGDGLRWHDADAAQCKFCNSSLTQERCKSLEGHFNQKYNALLSRIGGQFQAIESMRKKLESHSMPDKARFYPDMSEEYESYLEKFNQHVKEIIALLTELMSELENKKSHLFESQSSKITVDISYLEISLAEINEITHKHNERNKNLNEEKKKAEQKIKNAIADEIITPPEGDGYVSRNKEIQDLDNEIEKSKAAIKECGEDIKKLEEKVSNHAEAAEDITKDLNQYLGREKIKFWPVEGGYEIRYLDGSNAKYSMSEGEKTACALIYFLQSLKDKDFNLKQGIVVIDDPVCSLDEDALFTAASFIKARIVDARQFFILTHNQSFFYEVKRWIEVYAKDAQGRVLKNSSAFYQIDIHNDGNRIADLDSLLQSHELMYYYRFKIIHQAANHDKLGNELMNTIPNQARQLLERFMSHVSPSGKGLKNKFEALKIDTVNRDRIIRFLDVGSHGDQDKSDYPFPPGEVSAICKAIMEVIKKSDPKHYAGMLKLIEGVGGNYAEPKEVEAEEPVS